MTIFEPVDKRPDFKKHSLPYSQQKSIISINSGCLLRLVCSTCRGNGWFDLILFLDGKTITVTTAVVNRMTSTNRRRP